MISQYFPARFIYTKIIITEKLNIIIIYLIFMYTPEGKFQLTDFYSVYTNHLRSVNGHIEI